MGRQTQFQQTVTIGLVIWSVVSLVLVTLLQSSFVGTKSVGIESVGTACCTPRNVWLSDVLLLQHLTHQNLNVGYFTYDIDNVHEVNESVMYGKTINTPVMYNNVLYTRCLTTRCNYYR